MTSLFIVVCLVRLHTCLPEQSVVPPFMDAHACDTYMQDLGPIATDEIKMFAICRQEKEEVHGNGKT